MARILIVTVAHHPQDARIRHREIEALLSFGHEITFVAPFTAFETPPTPTPWVRTIDVPRSHGSPVIRARAVAVAARVVAREAKGHDIVLVHDPELLLVLAVARTCGGRPGPVLVWDVHEDVPAQTYMLDWPPLVQRAGAAFIATIERGAERRIKLLLAEHAYADRFKRQHPIVPNTVMVPQTPPSRAEDIPRIVYIGALTWARGAEELMAIAERLPGVILDILGNASTDVHHHLARAATQLPNVHYHGFVPNAEALKRLDGALAGLALLHPHRNYAHSRPTKIMEYMAHGVPTITTPNAASAEMVQDANAGIVIDFGDVDGAVDTILRWAADRDEQRRVATNAYAVARRMYDWNHDGLVFAETLDHWARERPIR